MKELSEIKWSEETQRLFFGISEEFSMFAFHYSHLNGSEGHTIVLFEHEVDKLYNTLKTICEKESDMKIKYHLDTITSKPDKYGNIYTCYTITRNKDGKQVTGMGSTPSNLRSSVKELCGGDWGSFTYSEIKMSIRKFNKLEKAREYLGDCDRLTKNLQNIFNN